MNIKNNFLVFILLVFIFAAIALIAIAFLNPRLMPEGDSFSYIEAIKVLDGSPVSEEFVPNRILTSFLNLTGLGLFASLFGGFTLGWLIWNTLLYIIAGLAFFVLVRSVFESDKVALLGTILFATNYGVLFFGLSYVVDMGGWMFFVLSTMLLGLYAQKSEPRYLALAFIAVGIGGLFKEYVFLALPSLVVFVWYEHRASFALFLKKIIPLMLLVFIPVLMLHVWVYIKFGYTYLDWFGTNNEAFGYKNWLVNGIKSFGSVLNLTILGFVWGAYLLWSKTGEFISPKNKIFLLATILSILPIFIWPSLTQRVVTTAIVPFILMSCIVVKKYENLIHIFVPIIAAYAVINFLMEPHILNFINLPI